MVHFLIFPILFYLGLSSVYANVFSAMCFQPDIRYPRDMDDYDDDDDDVSTLLVNLPFVITCLDVRMVL